MSKVPNASQCGVELKGILSRIFLSSILHHSSPCSAAVKNAWSYNFTPQYAFMVWNVVDLSWDIWGFNGEDSSQGLLDCDTV